jgi:uncharacterized OsmC-like protein
MSQSVEQGRHVTLVREEGYRFRVRFDSDRIPDLITDETAPIGKDEGPSPSRLLAAAVGHCLAASLLFCLTKARLSVEGLEADVDVQMTRNEAGRLRIGNLGVQLRPRWTAEVAEKAQRCLGIFEDFCLVTQAVRHGVPVDVRVDGVPVPAKNSGGNA